MKTNDAMKLKPGQEIRHRRYGISTIKEVQLSMGSLFGVVIRINNEMGKHKLYADCGCQIDDFLEDNVRNLEVI